MCFSFKGTFTQGSVRGPWVKGNLFNGSWIFSLLFFFFLNNNNLIFFTYITVQPEGFVLVPNLKQNEI